MKWFNLLRETFAEWSKDNCLRLGAALSFYTLGSLIPLLLVLASLGTFFIQFTQQGQDIREQAIQYIDQATGNQDPDPRKLGPFAQQLKDLAQPTAEQRSGSLIGIAAGFGTALFAASSVFGQLYESMNIVWNVSKEERPSGVRAFAQSKLKSFGVVIGAAVLLFVSTLITSLLPAIISYFTFNPEWLARTITIVVQFFLVAFVFALLFKYLPDIEVSWRDAYIGGLFTSVLWFVGQSLLSLYLSRSSSFTAYGILGSILAFLVYIYYASQIIFFGAEFTQVYARTYGAHQDRTKGSDQPITPEAALVVGTVMARNEQRVAIKDEELVEARNKRVAAVATGSIFGLFLGAVLGVVALIVSIARSLRRLRGARS